MSEEKDNNVAEPTRDNMEAFPTRTLLDLPAEIGSQIGRYKLDTEQSLGLFLQACEAIQQETK